MYKIYNNKLNIINNNYINLIKQLQEIIVKMILKLMNIKYYFNKK